MKNRPARAMVGLFVLCTMTFALGLSLFQAGDIARALYIRAAESKDTRLSDRRAMLASLVGSSALLDAVLIIPEVQGDSALAKRLKSDAAAIRQITHTLGAEIRADSRLPRLYARYFVGALGGLLMGIVSFGLVSTALDIHSPGRHFQYPERNGSPDGPLARFARFAQYSTLAMTSFATSDVQAVGVLARVLTCLAAALGLIYVSGIVALSVSILVE